MTRVHGQDQTKKESNDGAISWKKVHGQDQDEKGERYVRGKAKRGKKRKVKSPKNFFLALTSSFGKIALQTLYLITPQPRSPRKNEVSEEVLKWPGKSGRKI